MSVQFFIHKINFSLFSAKKCCLKTVPSNTAVDTQVMLTRDIYRGSSADPSGFKPSNFCRPRILCWPRIQTHMDLLLTPGLKTMDLLLTQDSNPRNFCRPRIQTQDLVLTHYSNPWWVFCWPRIQTQELVLIHQDSNPWIFCRYKIQTYRNPESKAAVYSFP